METTRAADKPPAGVAAPALSAGAAGETAPGPTDWAAVRLAYEDSHEPVAAIRARFGLTVYQLRARRISNGWRTRPPVALPAPPVAGIAAERQQPVGGRGLTLRLSRLVSAGLTMLEQRLGEEGMTSGNARALRELCQAGEISMRAERTRKAAENRGEASRDEGCEGNRPDRRAGYGGGGSEAGGAGGSGGGGAERAAELAWKRAVLKERFRALREDGDGGGTRRQD